MPGDFRQALELVSKFSRQPFVNDYIAKPIDTVFEAFGVDRLIFGSDWPVCLLAAGYLQVVALVTDYMRDFPKTAVDKVFGLNAARFYGQRASQHAAAT